MCYPARCPSRLTGTDWLAGTGTDAPARPLLVAAASEMGFNTWESWGCDISEEKIHSATASIHHVSSLEETTLVNAGLTPFHRRS